MGEERTSSYEKACELKYYQACHYKKWTDERGLSDLQLAGDFLGKRCKSDALCVVSGWAKGVCERSSFTEGFECKTGCDRFGMGL